MLATTILFLSSLVAFTKAGFFDFDFDSDIETGEFLRIKQYTSNDCSGTYRQVDLQEDKCYNYDELTDDVLDFIGLASPYLSIKLDECDGDVKIKFYMDKNCDGVSQTRETPENTLDCEIALTDSVEGECKEYVFFDTLEGDIIAVAIIVVAGLLFFSFCGVGLACACGMTICCCGSPRE